MSLPASTVVPIRPAAWPLQGRTHCGAYAVKAILAAYGLDDTELPADLHTHPISRLTGSSVSRDYYPGILRSYGLVSRAKNADRGDDAFRIETLKGELAAGRPLILSVANAFSRSTGGASPLKALVASHWISLWGYDDARGVFHTYDPLVSADQADAGAPIGNKDRAYDVILRIWPGSHLSRRLLGSYAWIHVADPRRGWPPPRG